ncbi:hypothetical protein HAX54_031613, partial [Datura stramonium]|nr:hypothetical protein [Datura stramonium]
EKVRLDGGYFLVDLRFYGGFGVRGSDGCSGLVVSVVGRRKWCFDGGALVVVGGRREKQGFEGGAVVQRSRGGSNRRRSERKRREGLVRGEEGVTPVAAEKRGTRDPAGEEDERG